MPTCASRPAWWARRCIDAGARAALRILTTVSLIAAVPAAAADRVSTPYGEVSLPFVLHQVPDAPVYYVIGKSGVPE